MKKINLLLVCILSAMAVTSSNLIKGTVITLADGTEVSIEEVREDDTLLTLDVKNNSILVSRVVKKERSNQSELKKIVLADGSELTMSTTQTMWSDKGWVASDREETSKLAKYAKDKVLGYHVDAFIYTIGVDFNISVLPIIEIEDIESESETYGLVLDNENAAFIANGFFVGQ